MTPLIQEVAQDSLARVLEDPTRLRDTIAAVFEAPEYRWDREVNLLARIGELWSRLVRTLFELRSDHPAAYYVLLGALVGVLIAILAHFAYIMWRLLHPHTGPRTSVARSTVRVRDAGWHLREARRLSEAGQFAEALGHRFRALALTLDRRNAVAFHPSKTPAEYLVEARLDDPGLGLLDGLVHTLYRHLFGGEPCTRDDVTRFDELASALESSHATN